MNMIAFCCWSQQRDQTLIVLLLLQLSKFNGQSMFCLYNQPMIQSFQNKHSIKVLTKMGRKYQQSKSYLEYKIDINKMFNL